MKRIAVVGLGSIANRHRKNIKAIYPEAQIYAMSSSGRRPTESIEFADELVDSIHDLIEKRVDLAIIASPSPFHVVHSIPFIENGIPLLIEKPVASNLDSAIELESVIKKSQTPVAVGYCIRYLSSAKEIKMHLDAGIIGQLLNARIEVGQNLADWRPEMDYKKSVSARKELGGGVLLELSHELDYAHWLLGDLDLKYAIVRNTGQLDIDVEDSADIIFTTNENAVVNVHLDFLQTNAYRFCRFVGSAGSLEWDLIRNRIEFVGKQERKVLFDLPEWDRNQMYVSMLEDFIGHINGQASQCISFDEAIKPLQLVEEVKRNFKVFT